MLGLILFIQLGRQTRKKGIKVVGDRRTSEMDPDNQSSLQHMDLITKQQFILRQDVLWQPEPAVIAVIHFRDSELDLWRLPLHFLDSEHPENA